MPYLIHDQGYGNNCIELKNGLNTVGRHHDNSIINLHMSLSRHHATLTVTDHKVTLKDLESRNGTCVNSCKITECELQANDIIRFGDIFYKFVEQLELVEPDPELNIVKRVSPESTRIFMGDLLQSEIAKSTHGSVLKLREQDTTQRALAKLQILLEVSKQLSSPEEPDKLLDKILDLLFDIVDVDRATILMVNETTHQLEQKAARSLSSSSTARFYSQKITNFVRESGDAVITNDALADQRFGTAESVVVQSIRASMCVPLKPKSEVIGVLYVDSLSILGAYTEEDLEFLTALANQAAIAIDNTKLYQKIESEAVIRAKFERFFPKSVSKKLKEEGNLEIVDTEVTALFSDISNFTAMSSQMEPRQVITMLNEYFAVMVEDIVFKYEGTLEKYIGDALLAVWGAPYKKPDDADCAVKAAIAMQKAMRGLNTQWADRNQQIQIHIGINSGKVAAGNIGSPQLIQYAAIGDTTNVTSRICNVAKAGEIVISQDTVDRLQNKNLPMEELPPTMVKGKTEPLQLYRLLWDT